VLRAACADGRIVVFVPARGLASPRVARMSRGFRVMNAAIVPVEIADQVTAACAAIERHLGATLQAMHLFICSVRRSTAG